MAVFYYGEARKLADKACRENIAKGLSPCLPVLDDFISTEQSSSAVNMGLVSVPLNLIIGTKSRGRVNAFAPNFMPVLEEGTEFATKWESLCQSHLYEGIHDPIKVYEYLNRYYVEEGNKRVSVLKFFDAVSIPAIVYRIYPEKTDDESILLYYEFVEFNKLSKINFIEFSKRGCFDELQNLSGKGKDEEWSEDERRRFTGAYYFFAQAYEQNGGEKFSTTVADAMLSYIKIYGFHAFMNSGVDEFKESLKKMWEEIELIQKPNTIKLMSEPAEEKKQGMISKVIEYAVGGVRKVAFIHDGTPEKSGWINEHESGRRHIEKVFEDKIKTSVYINSLKKDPVSVLEQAVKDGNELIFTTSPRLLDASLRVAIENPNVVIMNCSLNKPHRYVRSYYPRMYEVKFILGVLAGSLTESGNVGYVCDYPIYGQIAAINAFAIGAQMANPKAKVYIEWSGVKGADEASQELLKKGIHYISTHDTARFQEDNRKIYGLSHVTKDSCETLAVPLWKWGVYYESIIRRVFDNTVKEEYEHSDKALNYYWGMSAGVVDLKYCDALSKPSQRFADFFRDSFLRGDVTPFSTPFYTQDGVKIGEGQKELRLEQIISMDYLVENVIGEIPAYNELTPIGQSTVDTVGVETVQTETDKDGVER
ncbi:MAG: BMP family ABC transporter substrate-binding protein [Ruminococcus sp.]|nr:BMP family ABC transporter substrate-binding protein [Ruminococcus sp.]